MFSNAYNKCNVKTFYVNCAKSHMTNTNLCLRIYLVGLHYYYLQISHFVTLL